MATAMQTQQGPAQANDVAQTAPPAFQITGTYQGLKAPAVNGVVALSNNQIQCFAPGNVALQSASPTLTAAASSLCGDMTNGIAVYGGAVVAYMTGVGIVGASWYTLPALSNGSGSGSAPTIQAMSGDLANGLVVTDGTNLYSIVFNGQPLEWSLLSAPPAGTITAIAGDPTNGILLVIAPPAGGPSCLYFSGPGCSCSWVALTAAGTSLPTAKIMVSLASGTAGNGFVVFGENQFYTYTIKFSAAAGTTPATAVATPNKLPVQPPFAVTDLTGDATNGCTAVAAASGLIATCANTFATWTVVNAVAPVTSAAGTGSGWPVPPGPNANEGGNL